MTCFDFTGEFPQPIQEDDPPAPEGFDAIVDRLMALRGLSRDEAEVMAEAILLDDSA